MIKFNKIEVSKEDIITIEASIINSPSYKNVFIDKLIIDNQDTYKETGYSTNPLYFKQFVPYYLEKADPSLPDIGGVDNPFNMDEFIKVKPNDVAAFKIRIDSFQKITDTPIGTNPNYYITTTINNGDHAVFNVHVSPVIAATLVINATAIITANRSDFNGIDLANGDLAKVDSVTTNYHKQIKINVDKKTLLSNNYMDLYYIYIDTIGIPTIDTPCNKDNKVTLGVTYNEYPIFKYNYQYILELENCCTIPKMFINSILKQKAIEASINSENYIMANRLWSSYNSLIYKDIINPSKCNCHG